jgi:hypothetical protein
MFFVSANVMKSRFSSDLSVSSSSFDVLNRQMIVLKKSLARKFYRTGFHF